MPPKKKTPKKKKAPKETAATTKEPLTMPPKKKTPKKKKAPKETAATTKEPKEKKETWKEPKPSWGKSKARKLLYLDIMEGRVPREAKDERGKFTVPKLKDIYNSREEIKQYHYTKFSSRLGTLRRIIDANETRKVLDQEAFDNFVANHPVSYISHKGYIQWQGSEAQELALQHMAENVHNTTKWDRWYSEHPEFYENFPKRAFKEKIRQEIRSAKYLHTLEVRGKDARKTKEGTNEPLNE